MQLLWSEQGWEDYLAWQARDRKMLRRVNRLIESIERNGYDSIGKPEPLKGDLAGFWSVRIDEKNRIVFRIRGSYLEIWQCGSHYRDR